LPCFNSTTRSLSMSKPTTGVPDRANDTATGNPT
jgi:hypothetical protein